MNAITEKTQSAIELASDAIVLLEATQKITSPHTRRELLSSALAGLRVAAEEAEQALINQKNSLGI